MKCYKSNGMKYAIAGIEWKARNGEEFGGVAHAIYGKSFCGARRMNMNRCKHIAAFACWNT